MKGASRMTRTDVDEQRLPAACCPPIGAPGVTAQEAQTAAALFKSLADQSRVRVVNLLANSDRPICVCQFTDQLGLSQGTVSFHLKKLVSAGLIGREQRGTWAYYSLDRQALRNLAGVFDLQEVP